MSLPFNPMELDHNQLQLAFAQLYGELESVKESRWWRTVILSAIIVFLLYGIFTGWRL